MPAMSIMCAPGPRGESEPALGHQSEGHQPASFLQTLGHLWELEHNNGPPTTGKQNGGAWEPPEASSEAEVWREARHHGFDANIFGNGL
jgi:hypothetical protein